MITEVITKLINTAAPINAPIDRYIGFLAISLVSPDKAANIDEAKSLAPFATANNVTP